MNGNLEIKAEVQGNLDVFAVYYNGVPAGIIKPESDRGYWYRWGKFSEYSLTLANCRGFVIEYFNQLDNFIYQLIK
jgi:hypothetical protein